MCDNSATLADHRALMLLEDQTIDLAALITLILFNISLCFGHLVFLGFLLTHLHLFLFFFNILTTLFLKKRVCEHCLLVHNTLLTSRLLRLHLIVGRADLWVKLILWVLIWHSIRVLSL